MECGHCNVLLVACWWFHSDSVSSAEDLGEMIQNQRATPIKVQLGCDG